MGCRLSLLKVCRYRSICQSAEERPKKEPDERPDADADAQEDNPDA